MLDAKVYLQDLISALRNAFGERLVYVGLQGSYLRGEATESSDIDPMVVIDGLTCKDLDTYRNIIKQLPQPELSCGFLCGKSELAHWNALEMSHLLHTTRDEYGVLADLVPAYDERDIRSFIQMSIGNLYHGLCHSYVHADAFDAILPQLCKGVFFILQNLHHLRTGVFCATKKELYAQLGDADRAVMALCMHKETLPASAASTLLTWCQATLESL